MKQLIIMFCMTILMASSCKKDSRIGQPIGKPEVVQEGVNQSLVTKFTDYNRVLEQAVKDKDMDLWNSLKSVPAEDVEKMVANFLILERNTLIKAPGKTPIFTDILRVQNQTNCVIMGIEQPCPLPDGGSGSGQVSCTGTFVAPNTVGTIVFVGQLNGTNTGFTKTDFGFGGVTGTWTKIGETGTTYYNGVISYTQYYSETYTLGGIRYNQTYLIYGSATQSSCTTHGTPVVSKSN